MLVNKVTSRIHTTLLRMQLWTILILSLTSCSSDKWEVNPDDVDLGREFRVRTFYSDIQELPETDMEVDVNQINNIVKLRAARLEDVSL